MIRIEYEPGLLEQAVWLAARRDAVTEHALHAVLDPVYEIRDEEEREERFYRIFAAWFTRLKLDRPAIELLAEFPLVVERVERAILRTAQSRRAEGAELFVRTEDGGTETRRTLVIQLRPEAVVEPVQMRDALLRELQHVEDMLDDQFGYEPFSLEGRAPSCQVIRDRYRVLWDLYVEQRLLNMGKVSPDAFPRLRILFERAFTVENTPPSPSTFDNLCHLEQATHMELLAWAENPAKLSERMADRYVDCTATCT